MDLFNQAPEEKKPKNEKPKVIGKVKCFICKQLYAVCTCWTRCECGWVHQKTKECNNPIHKSTQ